MTEPGPHAARITWVGHATVLMEIGGIRVLTDPALTATLAHLRRRHPVPTIGTADVVALSHLHMDHLHRPSLRRASRADTEILLPEGAGRLLRRTGLRHVHEVRPGRRLIVDRGIEPVEVDVVHADHTGRRGPHTGLVAPALGYVFRAAGRSVYFAGDTGLFDQMGDIGPVDVALIPIWGWGSTLGERHLDPVTAAEATARVGARHVIPIHWGTYSPVRARRGDPRWFGDPLEEFRRALDDRGLGERLVALRPGDTFDLG